MATVKRISRSGGLTRSIQRNAESALKVWGLAVGEDASNHAPIKEGTLRRSIVISNIKSFGGEMYVDVGPDATVQAYAARQEFDESLGFGPTSVAAGATRPWLRTAFANNVSYGKILLQLAIKRALR